MADNTLLEPRNKTLQKVSGFLLIAFGIVTIAFMVLMIVGSFR